MSTHLLKYVSVLPDTKKEIKKIYKDHRISEHLDCLYGLIEYQMRIIFEQRSVIIAEKHHEAWKQYYNAAEEYNTKNSKFFKQQELDNREHLE